MSITNPKDSSRLRGESRARREQRQREAADRQAERDKRSIEEQIELLETRPGAALKERAKLQARAVKVAKKENK